MAQSPHEDSEGMALPASQDRAFVPSGSSPLAVSPVPASIPSAVSREELSEWLTENCGRGLPYHEATDLPSALHGLAYVLRQIEGTNTYKVFIGQCGPATSAIRWVLDYLAAQAIEARSGETRQGLDPKDESAVPSGMRPNPSQGTK